MENRTARTIRTRISQAYFYRAQDTRPFQPAKIPLSEGSAETESREIYWFDELLKGGIYIPGLSENSGDEVRAGFEDQGLQNKRENRAITILLTGPPGSGKSTLALELCYRLTKRDDSCTILSHKGFNSLYITSEAKAEWVENKAESYGWNDAGSTFVSPKGRLQKPQSPLVTIWETQDFSAYRKDTTEMSPIVKAMLGIIPFGPEIVKVGDELYEIFTDKLLEKRIKVPKPMLLVVDSVNTLETNQQPDIFKKFLAIRSAGPTIIMIVLDAESGNKDQEIWSYTADIVIRLDRRKVLDYATRTLEILKARYQPHVEGAHQLKIYPEIDREIYPDKENDRDVDKESARRAHPYREEGGIFIYPSIHYYLSLNKRKAPHDDPGKFDPPIEDLKTIFVDGFPLGRCIGFVGGRGGHKSHLGYLCLLSRVMADGQINNSNERALIISLRDDEGFARKTLRKILGDQFAVKAGKEHDTLTNLENDGRLEILFYPPGFITPEEFFHRMYTSIHRMKKDGGQVTVLFNSLDQLSARFPLCAEQRSFIPGMIEIFAAEKITSFFIAVEESGQPPEQYGLLSMADVLLTFQHEEIKKEDYIGHLRSFKRLDSSEYNADIEKKIENMYQTVALRVIRFAGGEVAGSGGILELVDTKSTAYPLYKKQGMFFTPFSPEYTKSKQPNS